MRWTEPERRALPSLAYSLWGVFISVCKTYIKKLFSLNSQTLKGTGVLLGEPWDHASLIWLLIISCQTFHRHNSSHTHNFKTLSQLRGWPYPWSLKAYSLLYEILLQDGIKHAVNVSTSQRRTQSLRAFYLTSVRGLIEQLLLTWGPRSRSISITRELVPSVHYLAQLRPTDSEGLRVGPSHQCFNSPPGNSDVTQVWELLC